MPNTTSPIAIRTFLFSDDYDLTDNTSPIYDSINKMCASSKRIDEGNGLGPTEYIITTRTQIEALTPKGNISFLTDVAYNISKDDLGLGGITAKNTSGKDVGLPGLCGGYIYWRKSSNKYQSRNQTLNGFEGFMGRTLAHERVAHALCVIIPMIFNSQTRALAIGTIDADLGDLELYGHRLEYGFDDGPSMESYKNYDYVQNKPPGASASGLIAGEFCLDPAPNASLRDLTKNNILAIRKFAQNVRNKKGKLPGVWDGSFFSLTDKAEQDPVINCCALWSFMRLPWYGQMYREIK